MSLKSINGLGNDLPPRWDGAPITWDGWTEPGFICPPPKEHERACDQCGAIDTKRTNIGRTYASRLVDRILLASRCRHCKHDTVYDMHDDHLWDLDPSDYSDAGSYELGQGALL